MELVHRIMYGFVYWRSDYSDQCPSSRVFCDVISMICFKRYQRLVLHNEYGQRVWKTR